jgi:probable rRNA maturation factor
MSAYPSTARGGVVIDIARDAGPWERQPNIERLIKHGAAATIEVGRIAHAPSAELSVVLTDDAGIRRLNAQWRTKDRSTNVLSFPLAGVGRVAHSPLLGDVVVSYDTLEREANALNKSFEEHFTHLIVHGLLHLFGYDHQTDDEAAAMEMLETRILARLGIADPYAGQPALGAAS